MPWAYFLQIVTPDGKLLANVNTYPAYGVLSTNYLPQDTVLHESYELPVTDRCHRVAACSWVSGRRWPVGNGCPPSTRPVSLSPTPLTPCRGRLIEPGVFKPVETHPQVQRDGFF